MDNITISVAMAKEIAKKIKNKKIKETLWRRIKNRDVVTFKKKLEFNATPAELKFKMMLNNLGIKYEFQKIIRCAGVVRYADFYLIDKRVVIEIDGSIHKGREVSDARRTRQILDVGISAVYRFTNNEVMYTIDKVRDKVKEICGYDDLG